MVAHERHQSTISLETYLSVHIFISADLLYLGWSVKNSTWRKRICICGKNFFISISIEVDRLKNILIPNLDCWHRFHIGYWISTHSPCSILLFEIEPSFWIWMETILWRNSWSRFHYFSFFIQFWSGLISNLSLIFRVNRPIFFFSLNIQF